MYLKPVVLGHVGMTPLLFDPLKTTPLTRTDLPLTILPWLWTLQAEISVSSRTFFFDNLFEVHERDTQHCNFSYNFFSSLYFMNVSMWL